MMLRFKRAEPVQKLGLALLILAAIVTLVGSLDAHPGLDPLTFFKKTFDDFYTNVGTELASIATTVLIIDRMHRLRDDENERDALILQMGSPDHSLAIEAVRMLTAQNWLKKGALAHAHLTHANLEGVNLQDVALPNARMALTNLRHAKLTRANLRNVYFKGADMQSVCLRGADLRGANLNDANIIDAHFDEETVLDSETILPDCTYWEEGTDISRYTNPQHPDFDAQKLNDLINAGQAYVAAQSRQVDGFHIIPTDDPI
jgi:hypothetical protein